MLNAPGGSRPASIPSRLPPPHLTQTSLGAPHLRVRNRFTPVEPPITSPRRNEDSYMRGPIAKRFFYERVRPALEPAMADFAELTGRRYCLLKPYRMEDAEFALVGAGCALRPTGPAAPVAPRGAPPRICLL